MTWHHATGHVCAIDDVGTVHALRAPLLRHVACDAGPVDPVVVAYDSGEQVTLRWPPRVSTLPESLSRCALCMNRTPAGALTDWPRDPEGVTP